MRPSTKGMPYKEWLKLSTEVVCVKCNHKYRVSNKHLAQRRNPREICQPCSLLESQFKDTVRQFRMNGCVLTMQEPFYGLEEHEEESKRCFLGDECEHFEDCLDAVCIHNWPGWTAKRAA